MIFRETNIIQSISHQYSDASASEKRRKIYIRDTRRRDATGANYCGDVSTAANARYGSLFKARASIKYAKVRFVVRSAENEARCKIPGPL